jgi:hypothetical protein
MVLFHRYGYSCHNVSAEGMKCGRLESECRAVMMESQAALSPRMSTEVKLSLGN